MCLECSNAQNVRVDTVGTDLFFVTNNPIGTTKNDEK